MDHVPVLSQEVLEYLAPATGETVLDCTLGLSGHARLIAPRLVPGGRYIGLDLDPAHIAVAPEGVEPVRANFAEARGVLDALGIEAVDGLLADLGFASSQVDDPSRGLSFKSDGPLDMRLDPDGQTTAADLVNTLDERELADLIYELGDERLSRRIARKIVEARSNEPIKTTAQLAALCAAGYGPVRLRGRHRIDAATRTFQALRIAVNGELENLNRLLVSLPGLLRAGARVVVISFHSLEDRRVKRAFAAFAAEGRATRLTKKPAVAGEAERYENRRSRSAKLRAIRWNG